MDTVGGGGEAAEVLPGFRFHPTDQELVGFYLRRKVERRLPLRMDLIKQVDIYKYDPWDLPRMIRGGSAGEKEWYFFCRRGRKYKNSARPNRVTASGFWKATGIDRPVHAAGGAGQGCIGLKKSLVYYRGSAGRGTKTDWMMHEFRLPPAPAGGGGGGLVPDSEAETWTICRIFKRDISPSRRPPPDRHHHHHHQQQQPPPGSIARITWSEEPKQPSPACRSTTSASSSDAESVNHSLVAFLDGETESNSAAAGTCRNALRPPPWCTGTQSNERRSAPAPDHPNPFGSYSGVLAFEDGGSWDELGRLVEESAEGPSPPGADAPPHAGC